MNAQKLRLFCNGNLPHNQHLLSKLHSIFEALLEHFLPASSLSLNRLKPLKGSLKLAYSLDQQVEPCGMPAQQIAIKL